MLIAYLEQEGYKYAREFVENGYQPKMNAEIQVVVRAYTQGFYDGHAIGVLDYASKME